MGPGSSLPALPSSVASDRETEREALDLVAASSASSLLASQLPVAQYRECQLSLLYPVFLYWGIIGKGHSLLGQWAFDQINQIS